MIVVFGAGGFIGTYVIDQLRREGNEVVASDLSAIASAYYAQQGVPYIRADITNKNDFDRFPVKGVEAVVHLACIQPANVSEQRYDAADYIRINVLGTMNILEYCRANRIPKILYTASHRNTQGMWPAKNGAPIRESDGRSIKFTGDYAMFSISESTATDVVEHYTQAYGIDGIVFRLPPVYGYGPHTEIFKDGKPLKTGFQIFIDNVEQGKPIELWGDASLGRDIVYVKDVAAAIVLAIKKPGIRGLFNIASGRKLSLKEQAEAIIRVFARPGTNPEIHYMPEKPNQIESYAYDISKVREALGWTPQYSFDDMLRDYRKEMESGRFAFLIEKRKMLMAGSST